jgi:hypothetical protein
VCRNTCGVSSIGAPRRWPGVTPLGLSRLSRPRIAAAIGHDPPACFSASPISSSALLPISCSSAPALMRSSAYSSAESTCPPGSLVTACCSRPASVRQPTGARRVGVAFESGEENRCESAMPKEDAYMAYIARPKGQPNVCSMPLGANLKPTALGTVFYDVVCPEACLWSPAVPRQAASPSRTADGQQERAPARPRRRRPPPEAD